jgi:capsular polysaccharide biosynthesis protein
LSDAITETASVSARLEQALKELEHYKRAYDSVSVAFNQSQTALSNTQVALQQTQAALNGMHITLALQSGASASEIEAMKAAIKSQAPPPAPVIGDMHMAIDKETLLPTRATAADLIATAGPGQTLHIDERYIDVKLHTLSKNSSIAAEASFYATHTVRAPELLLERLQNHYWFPESGFLVSKTGRVWRHSVLGQYADPHFLTTYAVQDRKNDDGSIDYIFHESLLKDAPVIEGLHLITSHYASHNFGHYMLDMVPLIDTALQLDMPMLAKPLLPWQRAIYNRVGVAPDRLREVKERVVFLNDVIVSNRHNASSTYCSSPHHREVFDRIFARMPSSPADSAIHRHVFLSRGLSKNRDMRNRPALQRALTDCGFWSFQPEIYPIDEQARVFANADLIVTEFGAVMANVAYCRPGTRIVEIIPEGQSDPWSVRLCAALGLEHIVLFQKVLDADRESIEFGGRSHDKIFFSYDADIAQILGVVDQLQSSPVPQRSR